MHLTFINLLNIQYVVNTIHVRSFITFENRSTADLPTYQNICGKRVSLSLILFKFVICYCRLSLFPVSLFLSSGTYWTNIYLGVWIYMYIKSYRVRLRRCLHFLKMYFINSELLEAKQQYKRQIRMPFHHSLMTFVRLFVRNLFCSHL